jgi:hypothetical protein
MEELFQAGQALPATAPQGQPQVQPQGQPQGQSQDLISASMMPTGLAPGADPSMLEYDEEAVTPEEQRTYDQFVRKAQAYMTKSADKVVAQMNNRQMPVYQNVGKTALMIAQSVAKNAKAAGQEISPEVMHGAGQEVVVMLMDLGDAAGIFPFKADSQEFDEASAMAFMYGAELVGKQLLKGPDAAKHTEEAGNFYASQIAGEQQRGEVDPKFWEQLQGGVAGGVKRALGAG